MQSDYFDNFLIHPTFKKTALWKSIHRLVKLGFEEAIREEEANEKKALQRIHPYETGKKFCK